jgi:hypothetical protein
MENAMTFINTLSGATSHLEEKLEDAAKAFEATRKSERLNLGFVRKLIEECDKAGVDFENKIKLYRYAGGIDSIDRSLLPLVRKAAGCPISKQSASAVDAKTVNVYVSLKSGVFKGIEFSYTSPAPKGKKCKIKEVVSEPYKSFALVCEK